LKKNHTFAKMNDMNQRYTLSHARIVVNMSTTLSNYIRKNKGQCEVFVAPFDDRLPNNGEKEHSVVQPDVVVVCDPSKLDERGCLGAPDMVVEVLSPATPKYDLNEKYNLYEASGIKEYWVIAPKDKSVMVNLLQDNGKYAETLYDTTIDGPALIPVTTLPGLKLDTEDIFTRPLRVFR
jgi:Uma2 family endonuclease